MLMGMGSILFNTTFFFGRLLMFFSKHLFDRIFSSQGFDAGVTFLRLFFRLETFPQRTAWFGSVEEPDIQLTSNPSTQKLASMGLKGIYLTNMNGWFFMVFM